MGMFDSVWAKCPRCGNDVEFQSKAGNCVLGDYDLVNAPIAVLGDLDGEAEICSACGASVTIAVQAFATVSTL